jgi:hypothetical protein
MDLRLLSKDHAVTVAVCDDTLTGIRYTTLKDTTQTGFNRRRRSGDAGASLRMRQEARNAIAMTVLAQISWLSAGWCRKAGDASLLLREVAKAAWF